MIIKFKYRNSVYICIREKADQITCGKPTLGLTIKILLDIRSNFKNIFAL